MQFYLQKRQRLILDPLGMQFLFWKPCSSYYRGHIWRLTLTIMNSYETRGEFNNVSAPTSACQCDHCIVE